MGYNTGGYKFFGGLNIWHIIIMVMLFWMMTKDNTPPQVIKNYYYDSTLVTLPQQQPQPVNVSMPPANVVVQMQGQMDSATIAQMIQEHISTNYYKDSIRDSSIAIYWEADVTKNKLTRHSLQYKNLRPTMITEEEHRRKVLLGMYAGIHAEQFNYGLSGSYINKRDDVFTIGVNPVNKSGFLMLNKKIGLRKRK